MAPKTSSQLQTQLTFNILQHPESRETRVPDKQEKEQLSWQVKHGLPNRKGPRGSKPGNTTVAKLVDGRVGICASLNCVVSVFVSSPARVKSPGSERRAGKTKNLSASKQK